MDRMAWFLIVLVQFVVHSRAAILSVRVSTERHVNKVDEEFLSFSVDPKYLFSAREKYTSSERTCMASSLAPAYVRIAGPSTATLTFSNSSIVISSDLQGQGRNLSEHGLQVSDDQWQRFARWASASGIQLVFALNSEERTATGRWNPDSALDILSTARNAKIKNIVWQLGYECSNQTIEEYLSDLELLRTLVRKMAGAHEGAVEGADEGAEGADEGAEEGADEGAEEGADEGAEEGAVARRWRVVGGDVTECLRPDRRRDFSNYVTRSNDFMDAIFLNGNSTADELDRMSELDRLRLIQRLSSSATPLWITERQAPETTALDRAVDWMLGLGHSARNGFSVHFRELSGEELYEPTLSFYMALLFKNLVGERVLHVDIEETSKHQLQNKHQQLFAHCASLRHQPVPGAITLYGANLDHQPARFSVKLARLEDGGDIMQFILGQDVNGNIIVNGRAMYYEGDIRPVVKRVRPYKSLLITLPPKSFGFWVLASTKVEACLDIESKEIEEKEFLEAIPVTVTKGMKLDNKNSSKNSTSKRAITNERLPTKEFDDFSDYTDDTPELSIENDFNNLGVKSEENKSQEYLLKLETLNNIIHKIYPQITFKLNKNKPERVDQVKTRTKRDIKKKGFYENPNEKETKQRKVAKKRKIAQKPHSGPKIPRYSVLGKILQFNAKFNNTRNQRLNRLKKRHSFYKNKVTKRHSNKPQKDFLDNATESQKETEVVDKEKQRTRRSIADAKNMSKLDTENEIDIDDIGRHKLYKMLHKLTKTMKNLTTHVDNGEYNDDKNIDPSRQDESNAIEEQLILKTRISENDGSINISERSSQNGLLHATLESVNSILDELKTKMNKVWGVLALLD